VLLELNSDGKELSRNLVSIDSYAIHIHDNSIFQDNSNLYVSTSTTPINKFDVSSTIISLDQNYKYKWSNFINKNNHISYLHKSIICSDGDLISIGKIRRLQPYGLGSIIYKTTPKKTTSNSSIFMNNQIVFPIPARDELYIGNGNQFNNYFIYSVDGSLMRRGNLENNKIKINELEPGYYLIKLFDSIGSTVINKFIKEN
jgi:hypothetical protein